jgi:hypothetical protein
MPGTQLFHLIHFTGPPVYISYTKVNVFPVYFSWRFIAVIDTDILFPIFITRVLILAVFSNFKLTQMAQLCRPPAGNYMTIKIIRGKIIPNEYFPIPRINATVGCSAKCFFRQRIDVDLENVLRPYRRNIVLIDISFCWNILITFLRC